VCSHDISLCKIVSREAKIRIIKHSFVYNILNFDDKWVDMQELEQIKENFLRSVKNSFEIPAQNSLEHINKLLATSLTVEQTTLVKALEETLNVMHKQSQNLTTVSDIKSRSFTITPIEFSPLSSFEKTLGSFEAKAKAAGVHLLLYVDPNAPKKITADEKNLTIVLENLLDNAIKFTNSGGSVHVDIRTKHITDTKTTLAVTITDTGVGIDKNRIKEYIQPSESNASSGSGLSTAFHILKSMNTQLKIASEANKGTRFSFSLELSSSAESFYDSHPDIKIGVLIDDRAVFSYAKLLYQYIIAMGLAVVSVKDINDPNINDCHGVFFVTDKCDADRIKTLASRYSKTTFIPAILRAHYGEYEKVACIEKLLLLPALPTNINQALAFVESRLPKEVTESNKNDHQAVQQIAEQAKTEKIKILVVEDNPINLKLVKVILSRYDFDVDSAENGKIGLDSCKAKRYDMVLMDIDMPVMDGITATKLIKEYENGEGLSETPIVALTSHDLAGERTEIMSSGLDEHMPKPLNVARLELMLEHYIGYKPERTK
jgi:CheY-like chemotaxis protein